MSDDAQRRFRLIAMGFAVVALAVATVAVVVVLQRGDDAVKPAAKATDTAALAPVIDHKVLATDVIKLQRNSVDSVVENGVAKGVRVRDGELAKSLGLQPDDVITAISGRQLARDSDIYQLMFNFSMAEVTTLYVEVTRGTQATLVRWRLDGDLRDARYGSLGSYSGSFSSSGSIGSAPPDPPDPLLDKIEKVDDTHAKVPRAVVDAVLADPLKFAKGARVVPSMKNGQPNGMKLYAIRPSSAYARLNFQNGDTIHSINGLDITTPDKALEVYTKIKDADELVIDLTRRGRPVTLTIMITK